MGFEDSKPILKSLFCYKHSKRVMRAYDGTVRNQSVWAWTTCMHKDFMCPLLPVYRGAPMAHEVL
ncbi:hypothetical protein, partial [Intestinimonas butyriciproducens]|uniref:hypothetical protein n=1 Tax=Intestinimonas butyriciproducens TaxID=1297617 RepID=UPI00402691FD